MSVCSGFHALDSAGLEPDVSAGGEGHDGTDGEHPGDAGQKSTDAVVFPDPASLEVWELDFGGLDVVEQVL